METPATLANPFLVDGRNLPADHLAALAAAFQGEVLQPGDTGYHTARTIWNASIDKHPRLIARCHGVADVVAAVHFAREHQLPVAVRGGGHNVGGRALCDGGLVVDLSPMQSVHVDPQRRVARVQGGATLGHVDRETHLFGLAVPAGINSQTGIGGLALGGGVGWLVRQYGLTCDNLLSAQVVTADGQVLVANAEEHADLFWGLRGGGGNFGVVTWFEFQLHPVHTVLGGMLLYPRAQAREVLRFFREFILAAPEQLTLYCGLLHTPDGMPAVALFGCYAGDLTTGERVLAPLRAFGLPLADLFQPLPFPQMQTLLDGAAPDGHHNYWKSAYLPTLSDAALDVLVAHANHATSPLTALIVEYHGGAASRIGVTETAFAQRHQEFSVGLLSQWTDPAESERHIAWARDGAAALRPFASEAYLLNFLGEENSDVIRAAFGPNYARLQAVKMKYDPTNFFRFNQNIPPAA